MFFVLYFYKQANMPQKTLTKKQFIKKAYDIKWF